MKAKKTITVNSIKEKVNSILEQDITQDEKQVLCTLLESVLHESGTYRGYNHNYWRDRGYNEWIENGQPETWDDKKKYVLGSKNDEYGRHYY